MILLEDVFNPNDMSLIPAGSVLTIFEEHEWILNHEPDEEIKLDTTIDDRPRYVGKCNGKLVILPNLTVITNAKKAEATRYIIDNNPVLGVKRTNRSGGTIDPVEDENFNVYMIRSVDGVSVDRFMRRARIVRAGTNTAKAGQGDEWLDKAMEALTKSAEEGYVELIDAVLPDIFWEKGAGDIPYRVVRSTDESNDNIMLMSPRHGEGLYIMKDQIELSGGKLLPWNKAIDSFMDNAKQEEDSRYLLSFREFLQDTKQGIFFRRDKYDFQQIIDNMAMGTLDDLEGLKESILKILSMIIESRTNRKQRNTGTDTTRDGTYPSEVSHSIRGGKIDKSSGTVWGSNAKKTKKAVGQRLRQARKRQDKKEMKDL